MWQEYVADMLCLIARPKYETEISMYSELVHKNVNKTANMTGEEVRQYVLKKLTA